MTYHGDWWYVNTNHQCFDPRTYVSYPRHEELVRAGSDGRAHPQGVCVRCGRKLPTATHEGGAR